jgi:hypothetical protein
VSDGFRARRLCSIQHQRHYDPDAISNACCVTPQAARGQASKGGIRRSLQRKVSVIGQGTQYIDEGDVPLRSLPCAAVLRGRSASSTSVDCCRKEGGLASVILGNGTHMQRRAVRKIEHDFIDETPAPPFRRIIGFDDRVLRRMEMFWSFCSVSIWRLIAAADHRYGRHADAATARPSSGILHTPARSVQQRRGFVRHACNTLPCTPAALHSIWLPVSNASAPSPI